MPGGELKTNHWAKSTAGQKHRRAKTPPGKLFCQSLSSGGGCCMLTQEGGGSCIRLQSFSEVDLLRVRVPLAYFLHCSSASPRGEIDLTPKT